MPTFEDDCSSTRRNTRSWDQDHRTSPPYQQDEKARKPREPYLRIDNRKLYMCDLEEMEGDELDDIVARLEADNQSIDTDLASLSGDAEIKAKDKKRFNKQWITTINDKLLDGDSYDIDDEVPEQEVETTTETKPRTSTTFTSEEVKNPSRDMAKLLISSINKHLSPELAAIVIGDARATTG